MLCSALSADIVASSSLSAYERDALIQRVRRLFDRINEYYTRSAKHGVVYRLSKGDYIECLIRNPQDALRVALMLKCGIKAFPLDPLSVRKEVMRKRRLFQTYGVRIAIGVGEMNLDLLDKEMLIGEALNRSGGLIAGQQTSHKEKAMVKNTLFFDSHDAKINAIFIAVMGLIDELLAKTTARQSEIILWKLFGYHEIGIASNLGIGQSSVNQQSRAVGWNAIEQAIKFYEQYHF